MTFTSLNFLIFFPLVVVLYNLVPKSGKIWLLLVASFVFYINLHPLYALLLLGVVLFTYLFTRAIGQAQSEKKRHTLLIAGIVTIIFPLLFFKYLGGINDTIISLLDYWGLHFALPKISLILPVGISFFTFMAIGYLVDVYNEKYEYERNLASVGLFLSFFPYILSGPIERAGNMFPQFKNLKNSNSDDLVAGAKMMLWGYFMKLCVADRLGIYVDDIFINTSQHNGTTLAFASILYPFQVYADLGGYSLIAIGVSRCLGIRIIPNFNRPFFATSMSEFWRRWHMSLIQWLTDYIYTPLSFRLRSWEIFGIVTALVLTFLLSGIWHGVGLTFIVWGLLQGAFLSFEAVTQKARSRVEKKYRLNTKTWYNFVSCCTVFVLFAFSQIFGRSENINEAFLVIGKILHIWGTPYLYMTELSFGLIALGILLLNDFSEEFYPNKIRILSNKSIVVRYSGYLLLIFLIILMGVFEGERFIYFQF